MKINGEPYFVTFANNPAVMFIAEAQSGQTMKKGEKLKQFTKNYVKKRQEDNEKRAEVCTALKNLLDRFITDSKLNESDELKYFINLFLDEPENPIRYEVSDSGLQPIYDHNPENLGWYRALKNSLQAFLMWEGKSIKYIKKCRHCRQYFIANDPRRQFCNEPKECKTMFYNEDRKRRMKEDYRNPDSPKFKIDYLR